MEWENHLLASVSFLVFFVVFCKPMWQGWVYVNAHRLQKSIEEFLQIIKAEINLQHTEK